jgi:amino acid permease
MYTILYIKIFYMVIFITVCFVRNVYGNHEKANKQTFRNNKTGEESRTLNNAG